MSETLRSDVLISGGGLVGQALALALSHHGLSVQIVDPADPVATIAPGFDGRASAIASATWQMFEVLGIAERLAGHGCPIRAIKVGDGAPADHHDPRVARREQLGQERAYGGVGHGLVALGPEGRQRAVVVEQQRALRGRGQLGEERVQGGRGVVALHRRLSKCL